MVNLGDGRGVVEGEELESGQTGGKWSNGRRVVKNRWKAVHGYKAVKNERKVVKRMESSQTDR